MRQGITKVISIHPEGHINLSGSAVIHPAVVKKHKGRPHGGAKGNVRDSPMSVGYIVWEL